MHTEYSNHFCLKMNGEDYLNLMLKIDKDLSSACQLAKRYYYFNHYRKEHSKDDTIQSITSSIDKCFKLNLPFFRKACKYFRQLEESDRQFLRSLTKQRGEGFFFLTERSKERTSASKKMIRLANGYFSFERFRNRVMYYENCYVTYSKKPLKNTVRRHSHKKNKIEEG